MQATLRQTIKAAIDAHKRQQLALAHAQVCTGCGGELEYTTRGCKRCFDRKRRRAHRDDPSYRALEQLRQKQRRRAISA